MATNKMQKEVCISGLGYVGLPVACALADSGYAVLGVDIDKELISRIGSGLVITTEPNLQDLLLKVFQSGALKASTQLATADVHIISVPTPLDNDNQPDISHVYAATDAIIPCLRSDDLVLIESTCPIGTTEIVAKKLRMHCPGIQVAYCPERVLPGNILHELKQNDRVIGGVDENSTLNAKAFYQTFTHGEIHVTNARTAEAVKLAENIYRDINIAYANELSMIADSINLDINELIRFANRHPRVKILKPGIGVGGHCIAVDPWFLVSTAPDFTNLTLQARKINIQKTCWVVDKIRDTIKKNDASVIACLGLSYKPNVSDLRGSPALYIVQTLEKEVQVLRVDPYIPGGEKLYEAIEKAEIIVGLVAHDAFLNIPSECLQGKALLDFVGIFK